MKTLISDYTVQLAVPYHSLTTLFKFVFAQTYYFTSFNQPISYDSHWWIRRSISFDELSLSMSGGVDSIDLTFDNADKWFSNRCLAESLVGKEVYIYQAALDQNNAVKDAELIFFGYVDKRRYNQKQGILTVKNHMAMWRKQTPPIHSVSCRWEFKEKADEVVGTDAANYRCIVDHPATAENCPVTGAEYASYWVAAGNSGGTWAVGTNYQAGTCQFAGRYLDFTSGGTHVIAVGETVAQGANSAYVQAIQVNSSTSCWTDGTATGVLQFRTQTGTFAAGVLAVSTDADVCSIAGDSSTPADYACDQSWEACIKYGNRANFGGNRWLPWLEDPGNVIWWGKSPRRD